MATHVSPIVSGCQPHAKNVEDPEHDQLGIFLVRVERFLQHPSRKIPIPSAQRIWSCNWSRDRSTWLGRLYTPALVGWAHPSWRDPFLQPIVQFKGNHNGDFVTPMNVDAKSGRLANKWRERGASRVRESMLVLIAECRSGPTTVIVWDIKQGTLRW